MSSSSRAGSRSAAAAKRQRLQDLAGVKGITTEALAFLLRDLHEDPVEPTSAWVINKCTLCQSGPYVSISFFRSLCFVIPFRCPLRHIRPPMPGPSEILPTVPLGTSSGPLEEPGGRGGVRSSRSTQDCFPLFFVCFSGSLGHCPTRLLRDSFDEVSSVIPLPLIGGGEFSWNIVRLDKVLQKFARGSEGFRAALAGALGASSDGRLSAIVYADEVTPGNPLRPENRRRFWSIYVGLMELGAVALSYEQFWIPVGVLRTTKVAQLRGGLSHAFSMLLKSILFDPSQLAEMGMPIDLGQGPQLLRLRIARLLGDESALKTILSAKGAAGLRPCILCRNVVALRSDLVSPGCGLVEVSCSRHDQFDAATDQDLWQAWDDLAAQRPVLTKARFELLEKSSGLTYNELGLLGDAILRRHFQPASAVTFDFLHCYLQGGVAAQELSAFLSRCHEELRTSYAQLDLLARAAWCYPKSLPHHKLDAVFSDARERSADGGWKASAGETLLALPLVRYFSETIIRPSGQLQGECDSLALLCDLVDLYMSVKQGRPVGRRLLGGVRAHLEQHQRVYGDRYLRPKHHFAWHTAERAASVEPFLDTFVLERKHQAGG